MPGAVTHPRPRNINRVPIAYAFRPRLRGRLTLRGLALRRNPWAFGESVSHTLYRYSCQHSRFRYLQSFSRTTFTGLRNAPLPISEIGCRMPDVGFLLGLDQALEHFGDALVFVSPVLPLIFGDVTEIQGVSGPDPHFFRRPQRHEKITLKFCF